MSKLITDGIDLSFIKTLPAWITGVFADVELDSLAFYAKLPDGHEMYVACSLNSFRESNIQPMVNNLGGGIFDHKFPGKYMEMVKQEAQLLYDSKPLPDDLLALKAAYRELTYSPV